jgi:hypothetical protein
MHRFSWRKLFLCLLVIACAGILLSLLYQILISHSLTLEGTTWLYLFIDVGVLIWNIGVLNHYRHESPGLLPTILVSAIVIVALSFMGVPALSSVKDNISNAVSNIGISIGTPNNPTGTYKATILGMTDTITFRGNILETNDVLMGKHRFTYVITGNGFINLTDPTSGTISRESFEYVKSINCVVLDGVSFYR